MGYRHHATCNCGCQLVVGQTGRLVRDPDTPKLAAMGLGYYSFPKSEYVRELVVCYDRKASC